MIVSEWNDREERQADARAEYERIMTTPSPDPMGAFIETGVIGFVFGEMWRRGVLTARDRRLITLSCVGAAGATTPIETHVWAALNSGDLTYAELDEFVLFFATQLGWPKASDLNLPAMLSAFRLAEERGQEPEAHDYERWLDPAAVAEVLAGGSGRSYAAEVVAGSGYDLTGLAPFAGELLAKDVGILVDQGAPTSSALVTAADAALRRMAVTRRAP